MKRKPTPPFKKPYGQLATDGIPETIGAILILAGLAWILYVILNP